MAICYFKNKGEALPRILDGASIPIPEPQSGESQPMVSEANPLAKEKKKPQSHLWSTVRAEPEDTYF
jgi:hypothetical protein